jgi:hypothetical protein
MDIDYSDTRTTCNRNDQSDKKLITRSYISREDDKNSIGKRTTAEGETNKSAAL